MRIVASTKIEKGKKYLCYRIDEGVPVKQETTKPLHLFALLLHELAVKSLTDLISADIELDIQ